MIRARRTSGERSYRAVLTRTATALEAEGSRSAMVALLTFAAHEGLSRTHHVVGHKIDFAAGPAAMLADAPG